MSSNINNETSSINLLNNKNLNNFIINVIGPHAGKSTEKNYESKMSDIQNLGYTYWICKSRAINIVVEVIMRRTT